VQAGDDEKLSAIFAVEEAEGKALEQIAARVAMSDQLRLGKPPDDDGRRLDRCQEVVT
jgi:hypothetical protein